MKPLGTNLLAHVASEVTTLATCWKLTLRNGQVMGFTSHDKNITIDAITYVAASGFTPSAVESSVGLAVDNLEIEGMLTSDTITENEIMAGIYDFAEIEIFQVNYADTSQGIIPLRKGWLGKVEMRQNRFVVEVRGLTQRLAQASGELYSPSCRAKLGDGRCKVVMSPDFLKTGSVTSVTDKRVFADSSRAEENGFFTAGKITFTSGNNDGLSMEVKEYRVGNIELALPIPYEVHIGDEYSMEAGCDKTLATCIARFGNAVNFQGEPHVPGMDRMLETAGTRVSVVRN